MKIKPFSNAGGYTTFDNTALDLVMPICKPNTWKVVCATIRQTRGWNKESDIISYSQFLRMTGIKNRTTLNRAIEDALKQGLILRVPNGQSFRYSINKEYEIETSTENGLVQKSYQNQSSNRTGSGTENGHTKERKKKEKYTGIPDELKEDIFIKVWDEWKQYRKEIRKPLKPTTTKRQLARMKKYTPEVAAAMLVQSIENGWQGIFELKDSTVLSKHDLKVEEDGSINV